MARLIFSSLQIDDVATFSSAAKTLSGITVEGLEISKEALTVEIEDGQTINEGFTGSITIRSVNTDFDSSGGNVLDWNDGGSPASYYVSSNGSIPPATSIKLIGANGSPNILLNDVYLMGHRDFSNGRVETVLMATRSSTNQNVIDTSN